MEAINTTRLAEYRPKEGLSEDDSEPSEGPGGRTGFFRATILEDVLGVERIYIDYEGVNPTGTHKDWIARAHVERAIEEGFSGITVGTCGNYGVAISYYASIAGLKPVIFVPAGYTLERLPEMRALGAELVTVHGTYEDAVEASRRFSREYGLYDANPGSNREVDLRAYSAMARWIASRVSPTVVFVPIGNGTTIAGLWEGFKALGERPRMIGVTTAFGNEILRQFYHDQNSEFVETAFNEPLVSGRSFDAERALRAIHDSDGYVFGFSDDTALKYAEMLRLTTGIKAFPASSLTLAGLVKFLRKFGVFNGRFVLVVTGGAHGG